MPSGGGTAAVNLDVGNAAADLAPLVDEARARWSEVLSGSCPGSGFLGWVRLPEQGEALAASVAPIASELAQYGAVVVVGIGGSYLGARAVIEGLGGARGARLLYGGNTLSARELERLRAVLEAENDWAMVVISKSGTTLETSLAFRTLRAVLKGRFGDGHRDRVVAVTDPERGALRRLCDREGYRSLPIPPDVGGRFSVLTPVGLLPIACAGFDIGRLLGGAKTAMEAAAGGEGPAFAYAAFRQHHYRAGKRVEVLSAFEPQLHHLIEWWKQLFGESEGKGGKGLFPAGADLTTDLHSLGQYMQQGERHLLETFLWIEEGTPMAVPADPDAGDGLDALAGRPVHEVNRAAYLATCKAHADGGVPNASWTLDRLDEAHLGAFLYHMEAACATSALMMGVNPFDQPGVEAYKRGMRFLLGV